MSNPRGIILGTYGGMADDTSLSGQLCPKCNGGSSKERSLSVAKKEGSVVWICHRNSCNFQGRENLILVSGGMRNFGAGPPVAPKLTFTVEDSFECGAHIEQAYGLSSKVQKIFGLGQTSDHCTTPLFRLGGCDVQGWPRIVIPLKNRDLSRAGTLLRATHSRDEPKALIIKDKDPMGIIWFNCTEGPSSNVIIVEDCYSAMRMTPHLNAVALLGTHLSEANVEELRSFGLNKYYLALDKDAFDKSLAYVQKYKNRITFDVVALPKDIKDMNEYEFTLIKSTLECTYP